MRRKKVRVKDIAKRLGISDATVSMALNHPETVNRSTRQDVLRLCEELGYTKPIKGKRRRTFNLALISGETCDFTTDFYGTVTEHLLIQAKRHNYNLILESWSDIQSDFPTCLSKNKVDGVITLGGITVEKVALIKQKNLPIVLCAHPLSGMEVHTVLPDGRLGINKACKHLIELGHKKIATITGGKRFDAVAGDRLEGYLYALNQAELPIVKEYIAQGDFHDYDRVEKQIDWLLSLPKPPTAIVCASDPIAFCAYEYLKRKGLKIPQDISITGFDNLRQPRYTQGLLPRLTTARVNVNELAKYTIEAIFELMKNPKKVAWRVTLPVDLKIGETTAKSGS